MPKTTDGWDWVGVPREMTKDAAALLQAISEAGDDDTPRKVFADCIEECGRDDWAGFVRRQCDDLDRCEGDRPYKLAMPLNWGYGGGPTGRANATVNRVTVDRLFVTGPWCCRAYFKAKRDEDSNLAAVELQSEAYLNRAGATGIYPRFVWYRGFMSGFCNVSPYRLFQFVESGAHAWHPWEPLPDGDGTDGGEFFRNLFRCHLCAEHSYDNGRVTAVPRMPHYYYTVARRDAVRWHIAGGWSNGLTVASLRVVPEPIARFLRSTDREGAAGLVHRYYYPSTVAAAEDLAQAARRFLYEAGREARARI